MAEALVYAQRARRSRGVQVLCPESEIKEQKRLAAHSEEDDLKARVGGWGSFEIRAREVRGTDDASESPSYTANLATKSLRRAGVISGWSAVWGGSQNLPAARMT